MNRKLKFNLKTNSIVCGDCEEWLKFIPKNSIDLIYIDPPFFSNKNYEIVWGNGFEVRSFGDRFAGGIRHYIEWMRPKIREAKRVLSDKGTIALHCDWHASHRLRVLLDDIFNENNFVNEVIWHYKKWTNSPSSFQKNHDNIFIYKKGKQNIFNKVFQDYADKKWVENTVRIIKDGKLIRAKDKYGNYIKRSKEYNGVPMHDVFHDISWGATNKERVGYRTQKPEALIKRFIKCFSNKNSVVLDFFGGGGTTASVCSQLNRRFIIGDVSPVAVRVTADRLISKGFIEYDVKALPQTKEEYLLMGGHKFADTICEYMGWESNPKKSGDGGIDGWANRGNTPIQIKNHRNKVGRPDIQKFLGAITDYDSGIFVAWKFAPSAYEYKAKIKDRDIVFIEVEDILGSLLLPPERRIKQQQLYEKRVKKEKLQSPRPAERKEDRVKVSIQ